MLADCQLITMLATTRSEAATVFYRDVLGLTFAADTPFALVTGGGSMIRIAKVPGFTPQPFTVAGWSVPDVGAAVHGLARHGVTCERFAGLDQDASFIWNAPGGDRVAWFTDPDGNLLSLTEFVDPPG